MSRSAQMALQEHRSQDMPPYSAGDQVVVTMRSGWQFVGELRAVSDDAWRIFDSVVGEVLRIRPVDVRQVDRLDDGE